MPSCEAQLAGAGLRLASYLLSSHRFPTTATTLTQAREVFDMTANGADNERMALDNRIFSIFIVSLMPTLALAFGEGDMGPLGPGYRDPHPAEINAPTKAQVAQAPVRVADRELGPNELKEMKLGAFIGALGGALGGLGASRLLFTCISLTAPIPRLVILALMMTFSSYYSGKHGMLAGLESGSKKDTVLELTKQASMKRAERVESKRIRQGLPRQEATKTADRDLSRGSGRQGGLLEAQVSIGSSPDWSGSDRSGSDRSGSDRSGSDRSGSDRSGVNGPNLRRL